MQCRRAIFYLALSLVMILTACSLTPSEQQVPTEVSLKRLTDTQAFGVGGRISLQTLNSADTAALRWRQDAPGQVVLTLSGPLGLQRTRLEQRGDQIFLQQDGKMRRYDPQQALYSQGFEWALPLAELSWWLRGLAAPDQPSTATHDRGQLVHLAQSGWSLDFEEYQRVDSLMLPRRIRFYREQVSGKILLKDWTLPL
ncbi:MAG: lipoprotein insertase outer membrane protein LolB [Pseudomonadota bacterium]